MESAAVAAAPQRDVSGSLAATRRRWQHQQQWRQREAQRWRTAQRRQHGGSSMEAAADSPALSANAPPPTRRRTRLRPWSRTEGRQRQWHRRCWQQRRRPWRRPSRSLMRCRRQQQRRWQRRRHCLLNYLNIIFSNLCCQGINSIFQCTLKIAKLNMCCS